MNNYLALCLYAALIVSRLIPANAAVAGENAAGKGFPLGNSAPAATVAKPAAASGQATYSSQPSHPASTSYGTPVSGTPPSAGPQSAGSPAAVASNNFENHPLSFPDTNRRRGRTDSDRAAMPSMWSALFAVLVVCGIFCGILYVVKKYLPGHRQLFNHPAMEVLGRTHLDQRRFVSLVRVGKRIIVVGVSPDEMRPLSEITDETEITGILELARPKTEAGLTVFQRLFQKTVQKADAAENRALADEKAAQIEVQMSTLRERVKQIRDKEPPPGGRRIDALG